MADEMEDFDYNIGMEFISAGCRSVDGRVSVGLSVLDRKAGFVYLLGGRDIPVDPDVFLSALTGAWPGISGGYCGYPETDSAFDLASLGGDGLRPMILLRKGFAFTLDLPHGPFAYKSDSTIVVEVLLALGNLLATVASSAVADGWHAATAGALFAPMAKMHTASYTAVDEDHDTETEFYAALLGHDVADYRRAARWLQARQIAFAVRLPGFDTEPTWEERDVRVLPPGMPADEEIDDVMTRAAVRLGETYGALVDQAVADRNISARSELVVRRFFPRH